MTEYEISALFYQVVDTAHAAMANFLAVVFAVVVVSHFAARKLDSVAAFFLVLVYSMFCIGMIREIYNLYTDMANLGWEIANYPGEGMAWHGMSRISTEGPPKMIPISSVAMCTLAFIGSLVFFFRLRRK